jgi:hypothetical protein
VPATASFDGVAEMTEQAPSLETILAWCEKHIADGGKLPCRVDEMTPREYAIFNDHAARSLGFVVFLRDHLLGCGVKARPNFQPVNPSIDGVADG